MNKRQKISVVLIAKDAADILVDCLSSIIWADEIILLDSGSSDKTVAIAKQYGVRVHQVSVWQGYGKQRQIAQSYASHSMILMIDCDERVSQELKYSILRVLEKQPIKNNVYSIARRNLFLGRFMHYRGWYLDRVIRLYPHYYCYNDNQIHESLEIKKATRIIKLKGYMLHLTCQDFFKFQRKQFKYAEIWAKTYYAKGKRCNITAIFFHSAYAFFKTLVLQAAFLDGYQGWLMAVVNAQYTFNKYTALWDLNRISKTNDKL